MGRYQLFKTHANHSWEYYYLLVAYHVLFSIGGHRFLGLYGGDVCSQSKSGK